MQQLEGQQALSHLDTYPGVTDTSSITVGLVCEEVSELISVAFNLIVYDGSGRSCSCYLNST